MPEETTSQPKQPGLLAKIIALIALVIAVACAIALLYFGQRIAFMQNTLATEPKLHQQLTAQATAIQNLQQQMQRSQLEIQQAQQARATDNHLALIEADYLVNLAAFNLLAENNVSLARQLLRSADQRIAMHGDSRLLPVREALGADLAELDAVPTIDVAGLIIQLNALTAQVEQLPRVPLLNKQAPPTTVAPAKPAHPSWKEQAKQFLEQVGKTLESLFVVRYETGQVAPLLPPDHYVFIVANIQSQLAIAQWAVLHRQPEVYQQALNQAATWIQRYFPADNPVVQALLKNLHELLTIPVKSPLPNLDRSVQAILQALKSAG